MKKHLIALLLLSVGGVLAQGQGFTETFDDPALPGWEVSGDVFLEGGILVIESGGEVKD